MHGGRDHGAILHSDPLEGCSDSYFFTLFSFSIRFHDFIHDSIHDLCWLSDSIVGASMATSFFAGGLDWLAPVSPQFSPPRVRLRLTVEHEDAGGRQVWISNRGPQ